MSRQDELESNIRRLQRDLDDPYVQDKWVEREAIEEARRELDRLNKDDSSRNRRW